MRHLATSLALAALVVSGACGRSSPLSSPAGPSGVSSAPPSVSGATVSGEVHGAGSAMRVNVLGTFQTANVDGAGRFRLEDVPPGNVELRFEGSGTDVRVSVGEVSAQARVELTLSIQNGAGVLSALSHVTVDGRADIRGVISDLDAQARSMRIGSVLVQVPAGAEVKERGNPRTFANLAVGMRVHVEGSVSGSTITAREVEIEDRDDDGDDDDNDDGEDDDEDELKGAINAITGSCPTLTLTIGGRTVRTNSSTTFERISCGSLEAGTFVEVEGRPQADGSLLADKVQLEDEDDGDDDGDDNDEAEFRGNVTAVGGSCPALSMTVAGRSVRTTATTSFERGACGDIRAGQLLQIKGRPNADGSVTATRVRFED